MNFEISALGIIFQILQEIVIISFKFNSKENIIEKNTKLWTFWTNNHVSNFPFKNFFFKACQCCSPIGSFYSLFFQAPVYAGIAGGLVVGGPVGLAAGSAIAGIAAGVGGLVAGWFSFFLKSKFELKKKKKYQCQKLLKLWKNEFFCYENLVFCDNYSKFNNH